MTFLKGICVHGKGEVSLGTYGDCSCSLPWGGVRGVWRPLGLSAHWEIDRSKQLQKNTSGEASSYRET